MKSLRLSAASLATCVLLQNVFAALELAPPFTDHAVLQREVAVPVWGSSDKPGATVAVTFNGQTKQTRVNQADRKSVV